MDDWDFDSSIANKTENEDSIQYLFIKIFFESNKSDIYGVALVRINYTHEHLEKVEAVVSNFSVLTQSMNTQEDWHTVRMYIGEKHMGKEAQANLTRDAITQITNLLSGPTSSEIAFKDILSAYHKGNTQDFIDIFEPTIGHIAFDKNVSVKIAYQLVMSDEYKEKTEFNSQSAKANEANEINTKNDEFFQIDKGTMLEVSPVVAPVHGLPIYDLKPGMGIMVRVLNNTIQGNNFNSALSLVTDVGNILPVKAEVKRIKTEDGQHKTVVHLKQSYYGKFTETESIKIKPYVPENIDSKNPENYSSRLFTFIAIIGIVALGLFTYLAFF